MLQQLGHNFQRGALQIWFTYPTTETATASNHESGKIMEIQQQSHGSSERRRAGTLHFWDFMPLVIYTFKQKPWLAEHSREAWLQRYRHWVFYQALKKKVMLEDAPMSANASFPPQWSSHPIPSQPGMLSWDASGASSAKHLRTCLSLWTRSSPAAFQPNDTWTQA